MTCGCTGLVLAGTSAGQSAQLGTGPGDLQPQQPQQHGVDQSSPVATTSGQAKARLQRPAGESQQQQHAAAETCNPAPVTAQSQPSHTSHLHSGDAVDRESARVCSACDTAAEGHAASALPAAPAALIVETFAGIEAPHVPPWQGAGRTATESRLADKHRQWWLSRSDDLAGLPMAEPPSTPGASLSASGYGPCPAGESGRVLSTASLLLSSMTRHPCSSATCRLRNNADTEVTPTSCIERQLALSGCFGCRRHHQQQHR